MCVANVCVNVCDTLLVVFHVYVLFTLLFKLLTAKVFFVIIYYINCIQSLLLCTCNFSVNKYTQLYVYVFLQMDTGFIVWSFQGRQLYRNPVVIDKFCQLLWRPRPSTLLTDDHIKVCNFNTLCMYVYKHVFMIHLCLEHQEEY